MKTTYKIIHKERKSGKGVLLYRITKHRETRLVSSHCEVFPGEWDAKNQKIVFSRCQPERREELIACNKKLQSEFDLLRKTAGMLETKGDYTVQTLVDSYRKQQHGCLFCEYIDRMAESLNEENRYGTARSYKNARLSFLKFTGGKDICLNDITPDLIKNYEDYLKKKNLSMNTISCYNRSLRAAFNQAMKELFLIERQNAPNPFAGVFTGYAKTTPGAITVEELKKLDALILDKPEQPNDPLAFTPDLFMFCFFAQGMTFSDVVNLRKENLKNGFIVYKRQKTGQPVTVVLEDRLKETIERYSSPDSEFIFPVLRKYENSDRETQWKQTGKALAAYNRNLGKLAKMTGLESRLTSYSARYSWASVASQAGIPIATISRGMGHESERTTQIYISRLDWSDLKKANEQILSFFPKREIPGRIVA